MATNLPRADEARVQALLDAWAADVAQLEARACSLEADNRALREVLSASLDALHRLTGKCDDLRERLHAALNELRAIRDTKKAA